MNKDKAKKILLFLPCILIPSTWIIFMVAAKFLGDELGYLVGFAFYWFFWGVAFPLYLIGWNRYKLLYKDQYRLFSKKNMIALLLVVFIIIMSILMYSQTFLESSLLIILVAIPIATINAICEETIWRGLYVEIFGKGILFRVVIPSVGFALSHISPQMVLKSEGGMMPFILSTFFLGLGYGWIAHKTGSMKWTIVVHSITGIVATGGFIVPSILTLLGM